MLTQMILVGLLFAFIPSSVAIRVAKKPGAEIPGVLGDSCGVYFLYSECAGGDEVGLCELPGGVLVWF